MSYAHILGTMYEHSSYYDKGFIIDELMLYHIIYDLYHDPYLFSTIDIMTICFLLTRVRFLIVNMVKSVSSDRRSVKLLASASLFIINTWAKYDYNVFDVLGFLLGPCGCGYIRINFRIIQQYRAIKKVDTNIYLQKHI